MVRFLDLPFSFPPSSVARMATYFRPARCLSRAGASRVAPTSPVRYDSDGQCFISTCSATATTWASSSDDHFLGASGLLSLALCARDGRHTASFLVQTEASDGHVNMRSYIISVLGSELERGRKCGLSFTAIYYIYTVYCSGVARSSVF